MIDEEVGWHKSLSNLPIAGVTGLTADVHFDIRDMSTDAGLLNEGQVTTIVRMNGYRFWGNRTTSDEPQFAFETAVRTSQAIQDAIAETLTAFVDNIGDEKGVTGGLPAPVMGAQQQYYFVTPPRTFGLRATYQTE